jgi:hypothetical protein
MGFFTRSDDRFVDSALDDTRRAAAIDRLSNVRVLYTLGMACLAVAAITGAFTGGAGLGVSGAVALAICVSLALRAESDLRFLKVVDRLRKEGRQPPA